jgi:protein TonB
MRKIAVWWSLLIFGASVVAQSNNSFRAAQRIRVSSQVWGGFLEHGVDPIYPEEAIRAKVQGDVILIIQTDEDGKVVRSLTVDGPPLLIAASIEALRQFRFRPYLLAGSPIAVESQIEFKFDIDGTSDNATGRSGYTFDVPYRPEFRTGSTLKDGTVVLSPRKVSGPEVHLPQELAGKSGSVYLSVVIGADGKVRDVKVVGGDTMFVAPVVAAVKESIFEPQLVNGVPSAVTVQESYHFGASRRP